MTETNTIDRKLKKSVQIVIIIGLHTVNMSEYLFIFSYTLHAHNTKLQTTKWTDVNQTNHIFI